MYNEEEIKFDDIPRLMINMINVMNKQSYLISDLRLNQNSTKVNKIYNLKEASACLGITIDTFRTKIKNKEIGASKIGKEWRLTQQDIDTYLQSTHISSNYEISLKSMPKMLLN